jgi:hypothetical protein
MQVLDEQATYIFKDMHIWVPSFLNPEDIKNLSLRANWKVGEGTGLA